MDDVVVEVEVDVDVLVEVEVEVDEELVEVDVEVLVKDVDVVVVVVEVVDVPTCLFPKNASSRPVQSISTTCGFSVVTIQPPRTFSLIV